MDKNAIKKYAIWARNELIARIAQKAAKFGVLEKNSAPASADSINGVVLTNVQKKQRQALLAKIEEQGYEQTIEEVAYTWFNRFIALRFMEVNNYLPSRVRVFTDAENNFKPEFMSEAINMDLDGINVDYIYGLKDANMDEELFRYMLVLQCNALNKILPVMFQKLEDYTELLLPDNLLREGSVVEKLVSDIPEEDWQDQVQIIGWLYQYYNTEPKDKVFANLKKNIKISKENIPAATQLFTPDWIVRYMVENSLGRLWVEGHPNDELKANWKYYLEEAEQEPEVQAQLAEIRKEYAQLQPEDLLCIDPCQGSGHILCYMFDVLMQIYEAYGYTSKEAVKNIVEKNIWGLDIDERASQLAYFSVMMKARQYDRRFFSHIAQPNVFAIEESNGIDKNLLQYFGYGMDELSNNAAKTQLEGLLAQMHDAKEYGSIINVDACDWSLLKEFVSEYDAGEAGLFDAANLYEVQERLQRMVCVAQALGQKYHAVVTNPPYMGGTVNSKLQNYVRSKYPDGKIDTYATFICRSIDMSRGFIGMVTPESWMFLPSYTDLRKQVFNRTIASGFSHLGTKAFDCGFGTVAFVLCRGNIPNKISVYQRLINLSTAEEKALYIKDKQYLFYSSFRRFKLLPNNVMAYWCTDDFADTISRSENIANSNMLDCGIKTGNNELFLRLWHEVSTTNIDFAPHKNSIHFIKKWYLYNKGGGFRKWYGGYEYVVNLQDNARDIKRIISKDTYRLRNFENYFRYGLLWPLVGGNNFSCRLLPKNVLGDVACNMIYFGHEIDFKLMAYMNSCVFNMVLNMLNPTVNYPIDSVGKVAYIQTENSRIAELVQENIQFAKIDWDSFENSWEFLKHPLIASSITILQKAYERWSLECQGRFNKLKANEEEINRIFINLYGLNNELSSFVDNKDISVQLADKERDIKSFISYAVGCMFGRYSLDVEGLAYAGGDWNEACGIQEGDKKVAAHDWQYGGKYKTFAVDPDNIIPICDDEYFDDDIAGRFIDFVKTVYGAETLEENLKFIADALGGKGSPREIIRSYFVNSFYADHCKTYQKRPIYWLFDSGKKNGFKCLIYMHRYAPDTIARIRTDYVHEMQAKYRTEIEGLETRIATVGTSERVKLNKQLAAFQAKAEELRDYEEKIHHYADAMVDIDLDDGVKVNYAKFADVLAKVK